MHTDHCGSRGIRRFELLDQIPIRWDTRPRRRRWRVTDASHPAKIHNLAAGGALLHVEDAVHHAIGETVEFTRHGQTGAVVVRHIDVYLGQTAIGVEFVDVARALPDLRSLLATLRVDEAVSITVGERRLYRSEGSPGLASPASTAAAANRSEAQT